MRTTPARREAARLLGDRLRDGDDRVGRARDERGDRARPALLHADEQALRVPVRVRDERVAQVGDPAHAGRPLDRGADEVDRVRRRGGHDDVDVVLAHDPDGRRDRRHVPGDVLVGDERAAEGQARLLAEALQPLAAVQLLRRLASGGPDVAGAVHPRLAGRRELVVARGSTWGRRGRARASRCRAPAGASPASAAAARLRRRRAGSRASRAGASRRRS